MKKIYSLYALITIFFVACSPQVTATPEVTVTLPPASPTLEATSTPEPTATSAAETVTIGGVTLTYGEDGVVTDMSVEGSYTDAQKAEKLAAVDPTKWGYKDGEAQIRVDGLSKYMEVVDGTEVVRVATWDAGSNEWLWNGEAMEHLPLFNGFAKTFDMQSSGSPIPGQQKDAREETAKIREYGTQKAIKIGAKLIYPIILYDENNKSVAIIADFIERTKQTDPTSVNSAVTDGWICFMTTSGKLVSMKFSNIEVVMRGFN